MYDNKADSLINVNSQGKQFWLIDILKFVLAFLVVFLHLSTVENSGEFFVFFVKNGFSRLCVPFYFTASGYFIFKKTTTDRFEPKIGFRYALRMFRLYLIWSIFSFPIIFFMQIRNDDNGIKHGLIVFIKDFIFTSNVEHLWFLKALAIGVLLVTFLLYKKVDIVKIFSASCVFYILGLLGQSYLFIPEKLLNNTVVDKIYSLYISVFSTTRNGLFFAFIFIALGALFAYKPLYVSKKYAFTGMSVSVVLLLVESFMLQYNKLTVDTDMMLMLVPAVFFMFTVAARTQTKTNRSYKNLRHLSTLIYLTHVFVFRVFLLGFSFIEQKTAFKLTGIVVLYISVCSVSVLLSLLIIKISEKKHFTFLKLLYT